MGRRVSLLLLVAPLCVAGTSRQALPRLRAARQRYALPALPFLGHSPLAALSERNVSLAVAEHNASQQLVQVGSTNAQDAVRHKLRLRYKAAKESVSHGFCTALAVIWIVLLGTAPFVAVVGRPRRFVSLADKIQGSVFLFWVIWGVLSPCVGFLEFESSHWEGTRSLDIVESVYYVAQVLTTVGYGDITPAKGRTRVYVAIHTMFALAIVVDVLKQEATVVSNWITRRQKPSEVRGQEGASGDVQQRQQQEQQDEQSDSDDEPMTLELDDGLQSYVRAVTVKNESHDEAMTQHDPGEPDPLEGPKKRFWNATLVYIFVSLVGVVFWSGYDGEEKSISEAFYVTIITLSTVGFGKFVPETEFGMIFDTYWMLLGAGALVNMVVALNDLFAAMRANELAGKALSKKCAEGERMSQVEYIKHMLLSSGRVTYSELSQLDDGFQRLHPSGDGTVLVNAVVLQ